MNNYFAAIQAARQAKDAGEEDKFQKAARYGGYLAPVIGSAGGALAGAGIGAIAGGGPANPAGAVAGAGVGAPLGSAIGGAAGSLVGAGLTTYDQMKEEERMKKELEKQARQEAVFSLLAGYQG